jgi:hypothetical protein
MPKNLTDADLVVIEAKVSELIDITQEAVDKMKKLHCDDLTNCVGHARNIAILARDASNLACFLLMRNEMQEQHAEINRLREAAGAK